MSTPSLPSPSGAPLDSAAAAVASHAAASASAPPTAAGAASGRKPRKRLFYLDLVRALATVMIVLVHFNNPFLQPSSYLVTQQPFGIYLGGLGVSLFLIISGAALALTYQRPINLKTFYWKRFKGIYPSFWIAWILATLYFFVARGGVPANACPPKSMIFTVLGVDGLLANFNIRTCYLLGEWFLGLIVMYYLVFPILLWMIDKAPKSSAVILAGIWGGSILLLEHFNVYAAAVLLPTRILELTVGIYFMKYWKRFPLWVTPFALGILAFSSYFSEFDENYITTFVGFAAFVLLVQVARFLDHQAIRSVVALISKYSYEIFLVHHVVIMQLFIWVPLNQYAGPGGGVLAWMLFATACILTFALAVALKSITGRVVAFITSMFVKKDA